MLGAFVARILYLARSVLWGDEILFVMYGNSTKSPMEVLKYYWDNHVVGSAWLPVPAVVENVWFQIVKAWEPLIDQNIFLIRLPGVLWGWLAVPAVYLAARKLCDRRTTILATLMTGFFFFPVFYSREMHAYPLLLALAGWTLYLLTDMLLSARVPTRKLVGFIVLALLLVYTHLTATFWLFAVCCALTLAFAASFRWKEDAGRRKVYIALIAANGAALVAIAPVYYRILTEGAPHFGTAGRTPLPVIWNDMVSKFFLGDRVPLAILAWVVLAAGVLAVVRRFRTRAASAILGVAFVGGMLGIGFAGYRTQYISARYFAVLAPIAYILFAEGVFSLGAIAARRLRLPDARGAQIGWALGLACLAAHVFVFLPDLYRLEEKGVPYASVAKWLNRNMRPGTTYFFDCGGWDLRYVPGYHPTPNLTPAVRIAWNGPDFEPAKRNVQRQIMSRFPESAYIETPAEPWPEAHRFYRRKYELRVEPLIRLRRRGVWIDAVTTNVFNEYRDIYYNTRDDAVAIARENGRAVFTDFEGFRIEQIGREVYARIVDGPRGTMRVTNLRDVPLTGKLRIEGALVAPAITYTGQILLGGRPLAQFSGLGGSMQIMETPALTLPPGTHELTWVVQDQPLAPVTALAVMQLDFVPVAGQP